MYVYTPIVCSVYCTLVVGVCVFMCLCGVYVFMCLCVSDIWDTLLAISAIEYIGYIGVYSIVGLILRPGTHRVHVTFGHMSLFTWSCGSCIHRPPGGGPPGGYMCHFWVIWDPLNTPQKAILGVSKVVFLAKTAQNTFWGFGPPNVKTPISEIPGSTLIGFLDPPGVD